MNAAGQLVLSRTPTRATPFAELARLEAHLAAGPAWLSDRGAFTIARRRSRPVSTADRRRIFHAVLRLYAIRGFIDTQCGFKLLTAPVAHDLFSRMRMTGYSFDVEVLLMARRAGYQVAEVPVNWSQTGFEGPASFVTDANGGGRPRIRANALGASTTAPHRACPRPAQTRSPGKRSPHRGAGDFWTRLGTSPAQLVAPAPAMHHGQDVTRRRNGTQRVATMRRSTHTPIMRAGPRADLSSPRDANLGPSPRTAATGNETGKIAEISVRHG